MSSSRAGWTLTETRYKAGIPLRSRSLHLEISRNTVVVTERIDLYAESVDGEALGLADRHKLQILEEYLQAFVRASSSVEERIYLDLFAGWPENVSRETDEQILGSVHRALRAKPPFTRLCLFEMDGKAQRLDAAIHKARPRRCSDLRCSARVESRAGVGLRDERDS